MTSEPGPLEGPSSAQLDVSGARFEATFRVRFDEAGADGLARPSTLLRFAQDAAWQHGASLGLDRGWYDAHRLVWLVRAVSLRILAPIPVGASLRLATAVVGHRRIWARRRVEMRMDGPGALDSPIAAVALTDWVLADLAGRIQRIGEPFAQLFDVPPATFEISRVPLGAVPAGAARWEHVVRPQELDPNGHLNNAVHLDWLDEAIGALAREPGGPEPRLPRHYLVEYLAPLPPGVRVAIAAWPDDAGWSIAMVRDDGAEAARARLLLG